jgi:hypothetical protein
MAKHSIARAEEKHAILQLAKTYSPKEIARTLGDDWNEGKVKTVIRSALRDLEDQNEEIGRAVLFLEVERLEEMKLLLMKFIGEFKDSAMEDDENSEKSFNRVMQSMDRLDKFIGRQSKLLGLEAPTKIQPVTPMMEPSRVIDAATELDAAEDDDDEEFNPEDIVGSL